MLTTILELVCIALAVVGVVAAGIYINRNKLLENNLLNAIFPIAELFLKNVMTGAQAEQLYNILVDAFAAVLAEATDKTEAEVEAAIFKLVKDALTGTGLPAIDDETIIDLIHLVLNLIQVLV